MRFIPVFAALTLVACNGEEPTSTDPTDTPTELTDEEIRDDVWQDVQGYESWGQLDSWQGVQPQASGSPHGPFVQIWVNQTAMDAAMDVEMNGVFPDGSILVKRIYDDADGTMDGGLLFVMEKRAGYGDSGWFWARYTDDGSADPFGDVEMCTSCHSAGADYSRVITDVPGTGM